MLGHKFALSLTQVLSPLIRLATESPSNILLGGPVIEYKKKGIIHHGKISIFLNANGAPLKTKLYKQYLSAAEQRVR